LIEATEILGKFPGLTRSLYGTIFSISTLSILDIAAGTGQRHKKRKMIIIFIVSAEADYFSPVLPLLFLLGEGGLSLRGGEDDISSDGK
jgi:hypothetical protein